MKKLALFIFSLLTTSYLLLATSFAYAANENFSTSAHVTYTVNSSGITHVQFAMGLTNNSDKYYASIYKIHLGFQDIQNAQASDTGGAIVPVVDKTSNGEDLSVPLTNPAFGKGKTTAFLFSFDTKEVASLNGSIWEVNIPGLSSASDFTDFTVRVTVPAYFGSPTYIKPATGNSQLTFSKDMLGKSGISLAFGDKQVYAFHLTYNLKNTQIFPVQTEIALPPNTSYQHIEIDSISPRPTNVTTDTDGNWLAQYHLSSSQIMQITVTGKAYSTLTPSTEDLTQSQYALFTKPEQYWQAHDTNIQSLAQKLRTPEAIYAYVVSSLHYDFARVSDTQTRLGAVGVLARPDEAVCLEFTDLFITLARSAGIPARELDGYGYTQNTTQRPLSLPGTSGDTRLTQKEILHAWPEYYDSTTKTWVMVDPTWENTTGGVDYFHTFDFDHLTLVIKGASSTYPIPAGGYKLPGQENQKDVDVTFAPQSVEPQSQATALLDSPAQYTAGLPMLGSLIVQNTGSVVFPEEQANLSDIGQNKTYLVSAIPPFGSLTLPLSFGRTSFLTNTKDVITIHVAHETITKSVSITPFSQEFFIIGGGLLVAILSIIIFIAARRARRLPIL